MLRNKAIILNSSDNVATALTDLAQGEVIIAQLGDLRYETTLREDIPFGHKFALRDIPRGSPVLKYGLPIGNALADIPAGAWVHVHNCRSRRFGFQRKHYGLKA